jgi:hypothetical protein
VATRTKKDVTEQVFEVIESADGTGEEKKLTFEVMTRLKKDLKETAKILKPGEVRFLVDFYYTVQNYRTRAANQKRAAGEEEPSALVEWTFREFEAVEKLIKSAMGIYALNRTVGQWSMAQFGVAECISAGLIAHIDIGIVNTAGQIWRFMGLDPTNIWLGSLKAEQLVDEICGKKGPVLEDHVRAMGVRLRRPNILQRLIDGEIMVGGKAKRDGVIALLAKRPWNARAKVLAWKIGQSFMHHHNRPKCFYGKIYAARKALEVERNARGDFAELAAETLKLKKFADKDVIAVYKAGRLPDGRIELRAERASTKLFLSHWFLVGYWERHQRLPPSPYALAVLGHKDFIAPPIMEVVPGLEEALKKGGLK